MNMSLFKTVKVKEIRKETTDAVSVAFDISVASNPEFAYQSGQYVTLKKLINGEDVRRSYSLSSFSLFIDETNIVIEKCKDITRTSDILV